MTETNSSLYSTTPLSGTETAAKTSAPASDAPKTSETPKASDAPKTSEAPKTSDAPKTTDTKSDATDSNADYLAELASESLKERTSVEDVTNKIRNVDVIEKDGTKIHAQLQAPSYREATVIDSRRSAVITDDGESMVVMTPDKFQEALAKIVALVTVNGKPFGRFGFKLADAGHVEGYKAIIDKADSFLTSIINPD